MAVNNRAFWFRVLAVGFVLAAIYHVVGIFGAIPGNNSPAWRHGLFVGIDLVAAWYLLKRRLWMLPLYVLLFVQQAFSHSQNAVRLWRAKGLFDFISAVDLVGLTFGLILLLFDARDRMRKDEI